MLVKLHRNGASSLTGIFIVANGEVRWDIITRPGNSVGALLSSTANGSASHPYNLGEMTPCFKVAHIRACNAVLVKKTDFTVPFTGNNRRDLFRWVTGGNILAIATTSSSADKRLALY